jgi:hypothetical protein
MAERGRGIAEATHNAFYDWVNIEPARARPWRIALPNADEVS